MLREIKIAITTKCPLSCSYCFARKDDQTMDFKTLRKAVHFFYNNSDKGVRLNFLIYGGEPCLFPDLLKKSIRYILTEAKKRKRKVLIYVGTNGVALTKNLIFFFKKHQVRIALSFGGDKELHDKFRYFKNKDGSFEKAFPKLIFLINNFPRDKYYVSLCAHPSQADELYKSFLYFYSLGARSFRVEFIYDHRYRWDKKSVELIKKNYIKIWDYIINNFFQKNFIFLVNYRKSLKLKAGNKNQQIARCFNYCEISTNGKVFLSSFLTIDDKFAVGDVYGGLDKNLFVCNLNKKNVRFNDCEICRSRHFRGMREILVNSKKIEDEFRKISNKYFEKISRVDKIGKEYIDTFYKNFY